MINNNTIAALNACEKVLLDELKKYLERLSGRQMECWIHMPIYVDDTYGLEGYWSQTILKKLYLGEDDCVYAKYGVEDDEDEFDDALEDCFNVGDIAHIIDCLP